MNLRTILSQRIGIDDIHAITYRTQGCDKSKQELFDLLFDTDDNVAYQAAWVITHFTRHENEWLYDKQGELINEALTCHHPGKRRLMLSLLYRQPLGSPPRIDLLEFCLKHMLSKNELPGVKTLCMKLAYEICLLEPELLEEFRLYLDLCADSQSPAIRCVRKNILKAMQKRK